MKKPTKAQLKAAKAAVDLEEVIDAERSRRELEREERAALKRQAHREALKAKSRLVAQEAGEVVADVGKSLAGQLALSAVGLVILGLIGLVVIFTPVDESATNSWTSTIAFLNAVLPFLDAQALCFSPQMVKPYASSCVPVSWSAVVLFFALIVGAYFAIDYTPKVIARIKGNRRRN
jgi:hypothetical protein